MGSIVLDSIRSEEGKLLMDTFPPRVTPLWLLLGGYS